VELQLVRSTCDGVRPPDPAQPARRDGGVLAGFVEERVPWAYAHDGNVVADLLVAGHRGEPVRRLVVGLGGAHHDGPRERVPVQPRLLDRVRPRRTGEVDEGGDERLADTCKMHFARAELAMIATELFQLAYQMMGIVTAVDESEQCVEELLVLLVHVV